MIASGDVSPAPSSAPALVLEYFSAHQMFGVVPRSMLVDFACQVTERVYRKGHHVYYADDVAIQVFLVKSGLVALTKLDDRGNIHVVLAVSAGDLLGAPPAVLGMRRECTATALVDSTLLCIPTESFNTLFNRVPDFARAMVRDVYGKLLRAQQGVYRSTLTPVAARLAAFLLDAATDAPRDANGPMMSSVALSHHDVALLLGTTRETVARTFGRLCRDRVIAVEGRQVLILRPNALRRLAGA